MTNFVTPFPIGGISDQNKIRVVLWINDRFAHVPLKAITDIYDIRLNALEERIKKIEDELHPPNDKESNGEQ